MASIQTIEAKAVEYEKRLAALEKVVAGQVSGHIGGADPVAHFKTSLVALREEMVKAKAETEAVAKERDEAVKKAEKLQYQCDHLKKQLRAEDAAHGHPADR